VISKKLTKNISISAGVIALLLLIKKLNADYTKEKGKSEIGGFDEEDYKKVPANSNFSNLPSDFLENEIIVPFDLTPTIQTIELSPENLAGIQAIDYAEQDVSLLSVLSSSGLGLETADAVARAGIEKSGKKILSSQILETTPIQKQAFKLLSKRGLKTGTKSIVKLGTSMLPFGIGVGAEALYGGLTYEDRGLTKEEAIKRGVIAGGSGEIAQTAFIAGGTALGTPVPVIGNLVGGVTGGIIGGVVDWLVSEAVYENYGEDTIYDIVPPLKKIIPKLPKPKEYTKEEKLEFREQAKTILQPKKAKQTKDTFLNQFKKIQLKSNILQKASSSGKSSRSVYSIITPQSKERIEQITTTKSLGGYKVRVPKSKPQMSIRKPTLRDRVKNIRNRIIKR
jgi:hypothetical protein